MSISIEDNLQKIKTKIAAAATMVGRKPQDITLIGVTKTVLSPLIAQAIQAGLTNIGENRVQEAAVKQIELPNFSSEITWHMIGKLQKNKIAKALELFDIIHSVDSLSLAEDIARRATSPVKVLLEVNMAHEQSKIGFSKEKLEQVLRNIRRLPELEVLGLMTVAPITNNPEDVRMLFRRLYELKNTLGLTELSMGMSNDFEIAVQEGTTMVRIGRALFGERPDL